VPVGDPVFVHVIVKPSAFLVFTFPICCVAPQLDAKTINAVFVMAAVR